MPDEVTAVKVEATNLVACMVQGGVEHQVLPQNSQIRFLAYKYVYSLQTSWDVGLRSLA